MMWVAIASVAASGWPSSRERSFLERAVIVTAVFCALMAVRTR